ncbi:Serine/threonine-protein phosphatase 6 regulatory ankyrin repeat subunit B [Schistosoma japonicum]|uniref:Serine/threonine-protein phosphatase 6 regulatory ankyrin repeat subunit B n=1 Tax=Schistosoma japonicum TaxID=6182 RepID=A0A4Z2DXD9_SCHJA|nr:Serine/threonine-protein phosphatase 6 regulatory ankyrin repeat subunit B [Schistosoma japonicum]
MHDHPKIEDGLNFLLHQLKSFISTLPNDCIFAELRDSINYVILQSKRCLKRTDNSLFKCKREIPTPSSDIDAPHIPIDFCSTCLPQDHFYSGLLPNESSLNDVRKLQAKEIDEIVFRLKQNESSKNFIRSGKKTSLHYAAYWGSEVCVQTLILQGSDLTARDEYGLTPIIWACESDRLGNLQVLLKAAKIRNIPERQWMYDSSGYHLIHHTLSKDDQLKCLEYLSNSEYALNVDKEGQSALHHAAMKANPYLRDKENCSPFHYATMKRLHFCLLIYERHHVVMEKKIEKSEFNENCINELTTCRPINTQFSHYQEFDVNVHDNDSQIKNICTSTADAQSVMETVKPTHQTINQLPNSSISLNASIKRRSIKTLSSDNNTDDNISVNKCNQLTEINSIISKKDKQCNKPKNHFANKRELLLTDKRISRLRNSLVPSKQINQESDELRSPSVKIINTPQISSDYSDSDSKTDGKINEISIYRRYKNFSIRRNHTNNVSDTFNLSTKTISKDTDKSRSSDCSSISDENLVSERGRNLKLTPSKIASTYETNSSNRDPGCHYRLLKRGQVTSLSPQNSVNNHRISMNKLDYIHYDHHDDEIIPLNMKICDKQIVHSSRSTKTTIYKNLLSPTFNPVNYKTINVNRNNCLLK